jgi:hypothetical protein
MNQLNHVLWCLTGTVVLLAAATGVLYLLADARLRERGRRRPADPGRNDTAAAGTDTPRATSHRADNAELADHASSLRVAAGGNTAWLGLHPPPPHPAQHHPKEQP